LLSVVHEAIGQHEQIKIHYAPAWAEEASERTVEPREIKVLNGHTYMRAYCTTRQSWRTFRVDRISDVVARSAATQERPVDDVVNWLTQVGEEGDEVVAIVEPYARYLFEPLPSAQWLALADGRHAVKFRVSDESFLDHLMVLAGPGAVVATEKYATAGHELARRISATL
jgi:proteasome accessory factor C